jgi:hypothetical protein
LDKARLLCIIPQGLADLTDGAINAVVGIQENTLSPDALHDLLPRDQFPPALNQEKQKLHRDGVQL